MQKNIEKTFPQITKFQIIANVDTNWRNYTCTGLCEICLFHSVM